MGTDQNVLDLCTSSGTVIFCQVAAHTLPCFTSTASLATRRLALVTRRLALAALAARRPTLAALALHSLSAPHSCTRSTAPPCTTPLCACACLSCRARYAASSPTTLSLHTKTAGYSSELDVKCLLGAFN